MLTYKRNLKKTENSVGFKFDLPVTPDRLE